MTLLEHQLKQLDFMSLERVVADCQQRIGSNYTDTHYVAKQQNIIDKVAMELERRNGDVKR